ncbi:MAG: hypothetical protein ACRDAM_13400 [Casimicrobium sp.]
MKVQHAIALLVVGIALAACGKKEEPKAAAAGLPAECQAYSQQVEACLSKVTASSKEAAAAVKKGFDDAKVNWASAKTDAQKAELGKACKAAQDAFQTNAKMMGC